MRIPALLALAMALATVQPAAAQSALANHDTNAPIDVDAARVEWRNDNRTAVWSGNVKAVQGKLTLEAATIRVATRSDGDKLQILRMDADGNVRLTSPGEEARSRSAIYDVENRLITMIGDVVLNQGQSMLRGQRMVINLVSGRTTLDPGGKGSSSRVTGRFVVPERQP